MTNATAHVSRISTACILAASGCIFAAQAAQADCPVSGKYRVIGRGPGEIDSYQGKAVISDSGSGCRMVWGAPNSSDGTGEYADGVLTIRFTLESTGRKGVVRYTRAPNGDLHGVWWYNKTPDTWGTESLMR